MKFLIVGDLHGNKPKIYFKSFDAIIAPGDFCSDATRKYMFKSLKEHLKNPNSKTNWWHYIGKKKAKSMVIKSIKDGRKILEFLNSFNKPVYMVPGNWDWTGGKYNEWNYLNKNHYKDLLKGLKNIKDVYHKRIDIGEYQIIGHGITSGPEYPQYKQDKKGLTKNQLKKIKLNYQKTLTNLSKLFKKIRKPIIFLSHNVPFNTKIDKITNKQSPRYGLHYGSLIARKLIDKYQPLICIGGHMHEHFKKTKIGKTTAINAGFGSYVNVLLELEEDKIKTTKFYKGK